MLRRLGEAMREYRAFRVRYDRDDIFKRATDSVMKKDTKKLYSRFLYFLLEWKFARIEIDVKLEELQKEEEQSRKAETAKRINAELSKHLCHNDRIGWIVDQLFRFEGRSYSGPKLSASEARIDIWSHGAENFVYRDTFNKVLSMRLREKGIAERLDSYLFEVQKGTAAESFEWLWRIFGAEIENEHEKIMARRSQIIQLDARRDSFIEIESTEAYERFRSIRDRLSSSRGERLSIDRQYGFFIAKILGVRDELVENDGVEFIEEVHFCQLARELLAKEISDGEFERKQIYYFSDRALRIVDYCNGLIEEGPGRLEQATGVEDYSETYRVILKIERLGIA